MATLKELIYNVRNLKAAGRPTDDTTMSDDQYKFIIDYYRAELIRQQQTKKQSVNENIEQNLGKCSAKTKTNPRDEHYVVDKEIPKAIELADSNLITYVGDAHGNSYQKLKPNRVQWDSHSRYTHKLPKWHMIENKLYTTEYGDVYIRGVFQDPLEALIFNGKGYNEMDPYDFEYPMSDTMINMMLKMMTDSELRLTMSVPQDNINDSKEN